MTYLEIDQAMVDITREKCHECKARLDALPKTNVTERKALQLEYGMYTFCGNAGLLFNVGGERTIIQKRRYILEHGMLKRCPPMEIAYEGLSEDQKMCFVAALQAEIFIRDSWLSEQYAELSAAEATQDTDKIFEFRIKIGAVEQMFATWEAWREANGVYPRMFEEMKS